MWGEVLCRKGTWKEDWHTGPYFKALAGYQSACYGTGAAPYYLDGHFLRADQPVGMQLPNCLQVRDDWTTEVLRRWRAGVRDGLGAGASARSRRQTCQCPLH